MPGEKNNYTYTLDGLWRPDESFAVQGMLSASDDGDTGDGRAGQMWAHYRNGSLQISLLEYYDRDYNPGIGLELLDTNYVMHSLAASYDVRSAELPAAIRSFSPGASAFIFESSDDGDLLFAYAPIRPLRLNFQNDAQVDLHLEPNWQQLDEPFFPVGIEIAPGRYEYTRYRVNARTDQSARVAGSVSIETGGYFDGELTTYSTSMRVAPSPHLELSTDIEVNETRGLGAEAGDTRTALYGIEARIALNPRLQLRGFYQWDDSVDGSVWNIRFSWEYLPLCYVHIVYTRNDGPGADRDGRMIVDRLLAKLTYLFDI